MLNPFQCLYYCPLFDSDGTEILLAASGSRIFSFNVLDGSLLSIWPPTAGVEGTEKCLQNGFGNSSKGGGISVEGDPVLQDKDAERPGKRRKLSPHGSGSESASTEIVVQEQLDTNGKAASTSAVIELTGSSNGKYVVAVTGEDKCIRVFELHINGTLVEISKR